MLIVARSMDMVCNAQVFADKDFNCASNLTVACRLEVLLPAVFNYADRDTSKRSTQQPTCVTLSVIVSAHLFIELCIKWFS